MEDDAAAVILILGPPRRAFMVGDPAFCAALLEAEAIGAEYNSRQTKANLSTQALLWSLASAMAGTSLSALQDAIEALDGLPA